MRLIRALNLTCSMIGGALWVSDFSLRRCYWGVFQVCRGPCGACCLESCLFLNRRGGRIMVERLLRRRVRRRLSGGFNCYGSLQPLLKAIAGVATSGCGAGDSCWIAVLLAKLAWSQFARHWAIPGDRAPDTVLKGGCACSCASSASMLSRRASTPATACWRNEPQPDDLLPGPAISRQAYGSRTMATLCCVHS